MNIGVNPKTAGPTLLAVTLLALLALALLPTASPARMQLDPGFGRGGRVMTHGMKGAASGPVLMNVGATGRIFVARQRTVFAYRPNGAVDRRFGEGGRVELARAAGESFSATAMAIDSRGRILLAGTSARPLPPGISDSYSTLAVVIRLLPDGRLDPSFARHGVLSTDFGLPAPQPGQVAFGAALEVSGVTVDARNRPIVTGGFASEIERGGYEGPSPGPRSGFIVRVETDGSIDPTFQGRPLDLTLPFGDGPRSALTLAGLPISRPNGDVLIIGTVDPRCRLCGQASSIFELEGRGLSNSRFAETDLNTIEAFSPTAVAEDRTGGIGMLGSWSLEPYAAPTRERIALLHSDGGFDTAFGHEGVRTVPVPSLRGPDLLAFDGHGRPIIAGTNGGSSETQFLLMRLRRNGQIDRTFAPRGVLRTGFGREAEPQAEAIAISKGQILLAGTVSVLPENFGTAIALARFSPSR